MLKNISFQMKVLVLAGGLSAVRTSAQTAGSAAQPKYELSTFIEGGPAIHYLLNVGGYYPANAGGYNFERDANELWIGGGFGAYPRFGTRTSHRFEYLVEAKPYFRGAFSTVQATSYNRHFNSTYSGTFPGYAVHGAEITPVVLREEWRPSKRVSPLTEVGCGVLFTTTDYPISENQPALISGTAKINFVPRVGIGTRLRVEDRQSLLFEASAVHISNGGTGQTNPGVNLSVVFRIGYSWFR